MLLSSEKDLSTSSGLTSILESLDKHADIPGELGAPCLGLGQT